MQNILKIDGDQSVIEKIINEINLIGVVSFTQKYQVSNLLLVSKKIKIENINIVENSGLFYFNKVSSTSLIIRYVDFNRAEKRVAIGLSKGISDSFDGVVIEHSFFSDKDEGCGGFLVSAGDISQFFSWDSKEEVCDVFSEFLLFTRFYEGSEQGLKDIHGQIIVSPISRDIHDGELTDSMSDLYQVNFSSGQSLYWHLNYDRYKPNQEADGLVIYNNGAYVLHDNAWSQDKEGVVLGMLDEIISVVPTQDYLSFIPPIYSAHAYRMRSEELGDDPVFLSV